MGKNVSEGDLLFEVLTQLGFYVRLTRKYWELIITIKHPIMAKCEEDVQETLGSPEEVRRSKSDPNVYLFYKSKHIGHWICAVAKQLDGEGFLITAYLTDTMKEGERIWPK